MSVERPNRTGAALPAASRPGRPGQYLRALDAALGERRAERMMRFEVR
jgi:hypothetical protein